MDALSDKTLRSHAEAIARVPHENAESETIARANDYTGGGLGGMVSHPVVPGPGESRSGDNVSYYPPPLHVPTPHVCPVCRGRRFVSWPPGIAGDVEFFAAASNGTAYPCETCGRTGVLWR